MRISSFLTFIVFCFLLFMEEEEAEEEAGSDLFGQLGVLRDQLRYLQRNIEKRGDVSNSAEAISNIKGLITQVDSNTQKLADQGGKISKRIYIKNPVNKVQASISTFFRSPDYSKEGLDELSKNISDIFDKEIQKELVKALH